MTKIQNITDAQIETISDRIDALHTEAGQHGDTAMLRTIAVGGTDRPRAQVQEARRNVIRALDDAAAQREPDSCRGDHMRAFQDDE